MRAGELCVRDVVTATATESVVDAARRMANLDVGDLIVVVAQPGGLPRPVGIVTDRDLVVQVLARPDRVAASTTLADIVQRELVVASEDDDVEHVVAKMRECSIRRIPIVDRNGGLQGVISVDDVLGWMRDQLRDATKLLERQGQGPGVLATTARQRAH
jgi:CBS domain-containing protein